MPPRLMPPQGVGYTVSPPASGDPFVLLVRSAVAQEAAPGAHQTATMCPCASSPAIVIAFHEVTYEISGPVNAGVAMPRGARSVCEILMKLHTAPFASVVPVCEYTTMSPDAGRP